MLSSNTVGEICKALHISRRRFIDIYKIKKSNFAEWLLHMEVIDASVRNCATSYGWRRLQSRIIASETCAG